MSVEHLVTTLDLTEADIKLLWSLIATDLAAFGGWIEFTYKDAEDESDDDLADRKQRLEKLRAMLERRA